MKTMICPPWLIPQWLCVNSCNALGQNLISCAQVHELLHSHCGDNQEGHIVFMIAYILCPRCFGEI